MKSEYREISRGKVTPTRSVVVSTYSNAGYTLAQQIQAQENDNTISMFLKGAFHVDDIEGLKVIRDTINIAIEKIESGDLDKDIRWDFEVPDTNI